MDDLMNKIEKLRSFLLDFVDLLERYGFGWKTFLVPRVNDAVNRAKRLFAVTQPYEIVIQEGTDYEYGDKLDGKELTEHARISVMGSLASTGWNRAMEGTALLGPDGKLYQLYVDVGIIEMTEETRAKLDAEGLCLHTRGITCNHCLEESNEQA